jgi:hypothetical protein
MAKILELTGISNHGKNRIREHGELWRVCEIKIANAFNPDKILVSSERTGNMRWIHPSIDENFKVKDH